MSVCGNHIKSFGAHKKLQISPQDFSKPTERPKSHYGVRQNVDAAEADRFSKSRWGVIKV